MRIMIALLLLPLVVACNSTFEYHAPDTEEDGTDAADTVADTTPDTAPDTSPDTVSDTSPDIMDVPVDDITVDDVLVDDVTIDDVTIDDVTIDDVAVDDVTIDDVTIDDVTVDDFTIDDVTIDDVTVDDGPRPEICNNGYDDDFDGRIDCMDFDCIAAASCTGTCYPVGTISCGGSVSGSNYGTGSTDRILEYPACSTLTTWTGPEVAYSFTIPVRHGVTINLTGLTADLDLFLLSGSGGSCRATSCITKSILTGTASESIDTTLDAGTYYIVVDGYSDAISTFTLTLGCRMPEICNNFLDDDGDALVDCADPDCSTYAACAPRCTPAATISCGTVLSGSTTAVGYTDVIEDYSCSSWPETGNEYAYTFMSSGISTGATFTIDTLSTTYLDLYLIGTVDSSAGCSPTSCIDSSETNDPTDSISVTFTPGMTYYVIVDGYADYTGTYRLTVTCP